MRAKLLAPSMVMNPLFNQTRFDQARQAGETYDVPQQIEVAAGYEIDDPQVWIHCCPGDLNSDPIAEPVDDECRAAVKQWMEVQRPLAIKQIAAQIDQIEMITNPDDKARLLAMGRAYGLIVDKKAAKPKASEAPAVP